MKIFKDYIALLESEIEKLMISEIERAANDDELVSETEHDLHVLFENRKHALEMCREYIDKGNGKTV